MQTHQNKTQGCQQTSKIKFPDISGRFLKISSGASSIDDFISMVSSTFPRTDPLPSPFNARISSFTHTYIHYLQLLYLST